MESLEGAPSTKRRKHSATRAKEKKIKTLRDSVDCSPVRTTVSDSFSSHVDVSLRSSRMADISGSLAVDSASLPEGDTDSRPDLQASRRALGLSAKRRHRFLAEMSSPVPVPDTSAPTPCLSDVSADPYEALHRSWTRPQEEAGSRGKWTTSDLTQLHRNVSSYMKAHDIASISQYIEDAQYKRSDFIRTIVKGINRTKFAVYQKVRLFYNDINFGGVFTEEEDREISRLHSELGAKWTQIGLSLGRSGESVSRRYTYLKGKKSRGPWMPDEVKKLKHAVLTAFETQTAGSGGQDTGDDAGRRSRLLETADAPLPECTTWHLVSREVGSRSAQQCREKWYFHLCWRVRGGEGRWTLGDTLQLVGRLSHLEADCEALVDWGDLARNWLKARSGYYLRRQWSRMTKFIPNSILMDLPELLDYINERLVPVWKKVLETQEDMALSDFDDSHE